MTHTKLFATLALASIVCGMGYARAQEGVRRTDLQTHDLSVPGREVVQQIVELQPEAVIPTHTHPGEEVTVVLEGDLLMEIAGKPLALKAGQAFTVMMGTVHGAKNTGAAPTKLLVTFVVEKGKPLRSPAQ